MIRLNDSSTGNCATSLKQFIVLASIVSSGFAVGQTPANDPHWYLSFSDEFNGTSINSTYWEVKDNFDGATDSDPGLLVPVAIDENVTVSGGYMTCQTNVGNYSCPSPYVSEWWCHYQWLYGDPYVYTSGSVESKPAYNFKYGYIEARMKVEAGPGLWSAFWTFRGDGVPGGPNTANEIDIFEILESSTTVKTNIHWDYCPSDPENPQYGCGAQPVGEICPGVPCKNQDLYINNTNAFHVYGLEWSPTKIYWYFDGVCVRVEENTYGHTFSELRIGIGTNVADPIAPIPPFTDHLPGELVTDYVRIYKPYNQCSVDMNTCSFPFSTYTETVKKSITIGSGGSCSNTQPANTTQVLRATDYILINGEFTVPVGSVFYADVAACY